MYENCWVRPLIFDDLVQVMHWRNHSDVRRFMFTQHEIGLNEHQAWFARASLDATRRLLIAQEGETHLGFVQFSNVNQGGVADWGFYLRPDAPKGSGIKLGWTALKHAFEGLGLHKVCGKCIESNHASIAFHKKLGFQEEGILREQQWIGDTYHTLICFGLIQREWQPQTMIQENRFAEN